MNYEDIIARVNAGHYKPKAVYVSPTVNREQFEIYYKEQRAGEELFKRELLESEGLTGHPKAQQAFDMAWDRGHADGLQCVCYELSKLAELLR